MACNMQRLDVVQDFDYLSGTSVVTESYWSDMDGKCIAPGTGDTWTREPAPQPGGHNNQALHIPKDG